MTMNRFTLIINQECFWNRDEFLEFLVANQGLPIELFTDSEGICLDTAGIYKLLEIFNYKDVSISTSNALETHPNFKVQIDFFDKWFRNIANIDPEYQSWDRSRIFGCFYNRPTWYRIALGSYLYARHGPISLINFRANPFSEEQHNFFDLNRLLINSPASINDFAKFMTALPLLVDTDKSFAVGKRAHVYEEKLKSHYTKFLIEIVAETWTEGKTFAPTEKTTRPINFKKPFIVYGSRDYLCYLRQMGFKTFNDFWDEEYDGYEGIERFKRILLLINSLSQKNADELESMYGNMHHILEHNCKLLVNKNYKLDITCLD